MSTNILDHVRTLAVLPEAKFQTVAQEEQRQHLQKQQVERVFLSFPRSATIAVIQMNDTKLPACSSDKSELQHSKTSPENVHDQSKSFLSSQLKRNRTTSLFLLPLRAEQAVESRARTVELDAAELRQDYRL